MSYQVTARKWRPRRFDQVVGQEHITTTLTNALSTGRIAQCYLLCGPRGVGKTTTARILAKALNCANVDAGADPCDECPSCKSIADGTSMDVLEIDGASNNSVDDVRDLREAVHYIPSGGSHKIYIIDEVHMLSTAAFNALLKTLEEPPERVVFVFATTEVQEVPETILSRCQRFNFRRIATKTIADHLRKIVTAEQINADDEALFLLARRADGALRDAESLLDQVVSFNAEQLTAATVGEVLGLVDGGVFFDVIDAIFQADTNRVLGLLSQVVDAGGDVDEFVRGLIEHIRHLLFVRVQGSADQLDVTDAERDRLATTAQSVEEQDLLRSLRSLMDLEGELRRSLQPRFRTELALVRLAGMGRAVDVGQLLARLAALEAMVGREPGAAVPTPAAASAPPAPRRAIPSNDISPAKDVPVTAGPPPASSTPMPPPVPPPAEDAGTAQVEPSPTAIDGPVDVTLLRDQWPRIVAEVRQRLPSAGNFLQDIADMRLSGSQLILLFPATARFSMGQVAKSHEAISTAVEEVTAARFHVKCAVNEPEGGDIGGQQGQPDQMPPPSGEQANRPTAVPKGAATREDVDPSVRSVLDAFDGEIV
ncbi:MAG: DNA polymerase III subunit gamma/tau [Gemmatimonadetes bacterium]|jgi:DNA polymerase-3 subunit gamma/tau|nr:DNA polymerase III subunit gamma/tau [Gemmatimonadota bacterium]MBT5145290.1 DNA polymerase III subunit gamma/tau [Gemmatimonadota bacterium]MBT5588234.1 DNA polymerase III subunit gamma/tau [Gemmatimonadota bacterium]MBT5965272.1 DNA polymerase III subunit gamma/tau [Gemmatimonadota bacterium]MBT6628328.1 DNA polymerase III subunit gamma/tau [Gemmatimonadota bacterium]